MEETPKKQSLIRRLCGSTLLWIVLFLIAFDCFLISVRPLQYVQVRGLLTADQEPLNDKLESLYSAINKPNMIILGSSLPMHACFEADWLAANKPQWPTNYISRHTGSEYLNSLFSKNFAQPIHGYNLGMPACMISDSEEIFKDVLAHKIKPKILLITVAPRDFIDNMAQPVGNSRYSRFFADRRDGLNLSLAKKAEENTEELLNHAWRFFKVRADYSRTIEFIVCSSLGRASNIFNAATGRGYKRDQLSEITQGMTTAPYQDPEPGTRSASDDLVVYRKRYLPFNEKRLSTELNHLNALLAMARQNNILPIVVSMPIHPQNLALLSNLEQDKTFASIAQVCADNNTRFINLSDSNNYANNDFSDSVHLRSQASKRFFDELISALETDSTFSPQLSQLCSNNSKRIASK
ncbi:MAG: DUF1574 domain-containing protein [Candidatus Obscuribacterales bacterium]|nr:DUF1574 domain-containing protein [Candidatus Obscuribacterales bacterium]